MSGMELRESVKEIRMLDSPTAATSVEDLIGAPTVSHSQAKVLVDRVEKSDTSLLISLVLLNMKSFIIIRM